MTTITGLAREASACSAAMRTSGLPPISASSLLTAPMRVERPAASTTAAMRRPFSGSGSARGCGRVTISISRPPTPMPVMSSRDDRQAGEQPHQHPVEAVFLRRARAAGRAEHRLAARLADQHQIAGIDRHAEMLDRAADRFDRRRDHVAPVGDRRGAEHDDQLGAGSCSTSSIALRERALLVRHAPLGDDGGAGRRDARSRVTCSVFSITFGGKPRQQRRDDADLARPCRARRG